MLLSLLINALFSMQCFVLIIGPIEHTKHIQICHQFQDAINLTLSVDSITNVSIHTVPERKEFDFYF